MTVAGGSDRHLTGDPMADDAPETLEAFRHFREKMNAAVLAADHLTIKRFFALDTRAYEDGALPARTKELLGLVASLVLRCDDCVTYHLVRCREEAIKKLAKGTPKSRAAAVVIVAIWIVIVAAVICAVIFRVRRK